MINSPCFEITANLNGVPCDFVISTILNVERLVQTFLSRSRFLTYHLLIYVAFTSELWGRYFLEIRRRVGRFDVLRSHLAGAPLARRSAGGRIAPVPPTYHKMRFNLPRVKQTLVLLLPAPQTGTDAQSRPALTQCMAERDRTEYQFLPPQKLSEFQVWVSCQAVITRLGFIFKNNIFPLCFMEAGVIYWDILALFYFEF